LQIRNLSAGMQIFNPNPLNFLPASNTDETLKSQNLEIPSYLASASLASSGELHFPRGAAPLAPQEPKRSEISSSGAAPAKSSARQRSGRPAAACRGVLFLSRKFVKIPVFDKKVSKSSARVSGQEIASWAAPLPSKSLEIVTWKFVLYVFKKIPD